MSFPDSIKGPVTNSITRSRQRRSLFLLMTDSNLYFYVEHAKMYTYLANRKRVYSSHHLLPPGETLTVCIGLYSNAITTQSSFILSSCNNVFDWTDLLLQLRSTDMVFLTFHSVHDFP